MITISYHQHRLLLTTALTFAACTPSPAPAPPDVVIVSSDGPAPISDIDPCIVERAICRDRIIRAPDGGALCPLPPGCKP